jgi:SOS response regulatory protein OraA/RecX
MDFIMHSALNYVYQRYLSEQELFHLLSNEFGEHPAASTAIQSVLSSLKEADLINDKRLSPFIM